MALGVTIPVKLNEQCGPSDLFPKCVARPRSYARALAFDSQELRQMRWLAANEGLHLRMDRQPLVFLKEDNGRRFYATDNQSVVFLGEREGQRVYQVVLKFEGFPRSVKRPVLWSLMPWEKPVREDSFLYVFVDLATQQVLETL